MKKFGQLKQDIIHHLTENYQTNSFSDSFKKVFKTINESKDFKEVYTLYSQIEESAFGGDAEMAELFLNEAIDAIKAKVGGRGVKTVVKKLAGEVNAAVEKNTIYEHIDTLVYSTSVAQIQGRIQAKRNLITHLSRIKAEEPTFEPVNEAVLITLLTNQYNDMFGNINETEREKLNHYLNMDETQLQESIRQKKTTAVGKLNMLLNENTETAVQKKIHETLSEVMEMEPTKYNLYKLDNLIQDLT